MDCSSLFVFVTCVLIVTYRANGRNRELNFPGYYTFANKRLRNHKIKTEHVRDLDQCEFLCYQHDDCVSVNINKVPDSETGQHACELNNSTHMEHDENMVDDNTYLYRGAKNTCGKNSPCHHKGGICQSGFTKRGYRCLCRPGYKGEHCSKKKWKKIIGDASVCFGARDETYGTFIMKESDLIFTFMLKHKSGSLSCNEDYPDSYWGCENPSYGNKTLATVITYPNKTALLPANYLRDLSKLNCGREYTYQIKGVGSNSTKLVFKKLPVPLSVSVDQEFQIWYSQDLTNCSESGNAGKTCADVYAWYA